MKRFLFLLLLGAFAVAATACGDSSSNTGSLVSPATGSSPSAAAPSTFKVGDQIKVGDLVFSVTAVKAPVSSGNQYLTPKMGQYMTVAVSIQNTGTKPVTVSSLVSFTLRDANGQSYTETILPNTPTPPDGEIAPGDRLAGTMVFDVPKGTSFRLYFKNDLFSSGSVIVDLGTH